MRILLYGGTFDPPHNGHMHNLKLAAACVKPDKVVIMPAGAAPHKAASSTPARLRMEMCGCFCALAGSADIPQLEISDWEICQAQEGKKNYSDTTVTMLAQKYPGAQIYMTVGSDMLLSFDSWHNWQHLLQSCVLVAVSRECDDFAALHTKAAEIDPTGTHIVFAQGAALPMASSRLRAQMQNGIVCTDALPENVQRIIEREEVYLPCRTQH